MTDFFSFEGKIVFFSQDISVSVHYSNFKIFDVIIDVNAY